MNQLPDLKNNIRKRVLSIRDNLDDQSYQNWSQKICEGIISHPFVKNSKIIMLYRPIRKEPNMDLIAEDLLAQGKTLVYPRVFDNAIIPYQINSLQHDFEIGYHNIPEPKNTLPKIDPSEIDTVILPGCSFDISGNRIGWGAAHYDRFFTSPDFKGKKLGVGYTFQILKSIPIETHDIKLDALISESRQLIFI